MPNRIKRQFLSGGGWLAITRRRLLGVRIRPLAQATMALFNGDRRRRVLTDQILTAATDGEAAEKPARSKSKTAPAYAPGALTNQPTVSDLTPRRYSTIALWFFLAALVVAGLEALYVYRADWATVLPAAYAEALDLASRGGLASWFSSLLLSLAAATSLVIYSVRRHRADDHRGRYRVWIVAAIVWLGFSAGIVSGLHLALMSVAVSLSSMQGWLGGAIWWLAPAGVAVGGMGLRLAIEMRRCVFGTVLMVLALACWGTAAAAHFGLLPVAAGTETIMVAAGTLMAGHTLLLIALFVYARYVVLEAGGKIVPRASKPRREKKPKAARSSDDAADKDGAEESAIKKSRNLRVDPAHSAKSSTTTHSGRAPLQTSTKASSSQWTDGSEDDDYEEDDETRKLSKADRKRIRRQRAREDRASL